MKKVGLISLGCDKNRVDSENILYSFKERGYIIVNDEKEADVIVINTCSFIEDAKRESIDVILEQISKKTTNKKIIVAGCLAERYGEELKKSLSDVDVFVGINNYQNIVDLVEGESLPKEKKPYEKGRIITTPYHYAYLKIADGCDNFCSYCAIPYIRGSYRSEPIEKLLKEAENLQLEGVKELIIVAQDITRYGVDLYNEYRLKTLVKELIKMDFSKIRLMYAYPELIDNELIQMIATEEKLAKYIDIPMQHFDQNVLNRMNRRSSVVDLLDLVERIKKANVDIAIRSSFIVGFPGESEQEFNNLKQFIERGLIDYAGFFSYSKEEGTDAFGYKGHITKKVKKSRLTELSKLQSQNIVKNHQKYKGRVIKVLYEGIDYDRKCFYGRSEQNAPDIDTKVYFTSSIPVDIGEYYDIEIKESGFHLFGELAVWNQ